jgi:NAD-dependent dihydropyrimidine dehydrogenase PreA subunit
VITVNRYRCGYCGACVSVCPRDALDLVETFIEVSDQCTDCGICTRVCPMGALELVEGEEEEA